MSRTRHRRTSQARRVQAAEERRATESAERELRLRAKKVRALVEAVELELDAMGRRAPSLRPEIGHANRRARQLLYCANSLLKLTGASS